MTVTTAVIIILCIAVICLLVSISDINANLNRIGGSIMTQRDLRRSNEIKIYQKIKRLMDYLNLEEVSQESPIIRKRKT